MNIILIGAPATGKDTQGQHLMNDHKFIRIVTGEMLRQERNSGSELGNQIKDLIDNGNFVSDELINDIITTHLSNLEVPEGYGLLFDGYPRTVEQAKYLDTLITIDKVVLLNVNEEVLVQRIIKRAKLLKRADDLDETVVRHRMEVYRTETFPVTDYYKNKLYTINSDRSIKEVYQDIAKIINE